MPGNLKTLAAHAALWVSYTFLGIIAYGYPDVLSSIIETPASFSVSIAIFYAHAYWALPKYFENKRWLAFLIATFVILLSSIFLRFLFYIWIPKLFAYNFSVTYLPAAKNIVSFSWQWLSFTIISTGFWFAKKSLQIERKNRERERLLLENAALRAQINPHFLFNTLDSFRIESKPVLPEMSQSISALIEIMRSAFTQPNEAGLIELEREVKAINALIRIYRRRFPYIYLNYTCNIKSSRKLFVVPHVLLTIVENMFKHGDFTDELHPLQIEISADEERIQMLTYNAKDYRIQDNSHGIGMNFIVRQLDEVYGTDYTLKIDNEANDYTVHLNLPS